MATLPPPARCLVVGECDAFGQSLLSERIVGGQQHGRFGPGVGRASFLAGDATYDEELLKQRIVDGFSENIGVSLNTLDRIAAFGIDVVVNTAGIMLLSPLTELNLDDFDRMHRTNVRGTFVVSQQAARRVRRGGAIINFSTSVTKIALPGYTAYAATKGAVDAMTLILAKEMRGRDVTVNAVAPGPTATPLFLDGKPQEVIDHLKSMPPLERLGEPADIAEAVAFLAGPARWVNGQVIYANGGVV
jgi:3-oxoacyl-[acyl-carrier protein] reductase